MDIYYILIFILGLIFGSFYNVCIYRIPKGESIIKIPSHCINCGTRLRWLDLVPLVSFVLQRGRCRYCKDKISYRYIFVEVLTGLCFVALYQKYGLSTEYIASLFLVSILIIVAFIDLEHCIIPNGLVIFGIVGGAVLFAYNIFHSVSFYGDGVWWNPLIGSLIGSGSLLAVAFIGSIIYKTDEAMGGGDIKIFFPIGLFLGWKLVIVALLSSIFIGGIVNLVLLILKKVTKEQSTPFGPFISIGTFIALLYGWDLINFYTGTYL